MKEHGQGENPLHSGVNIFLWFLNIMRMGRFQYFSQFDQNEYINLTEETLAYLSHERVKIVDPDMDPDLVDWKSKKVEQISALM